MENHIGIQSVKLAVSANITGDAIVVTGISTLKNSDHRALFSSGPAFVEPLGTHTRNAQRCQECESSEFHG